MSGYGTALRSLSERLDSELALLRQREHTEVLSVVEAARERVRILERHLAACRELRRQWHLDPLDTPFGRTFVIQDPDGYAIPIHPSAAVQCPQEGSG